MDFEYDPEKSAANKAKHGIDFEQAKALWDDVRMLEVPARTTDEPRFVMIGRIGDRCWAAVCTRRDDRIRLISVRRAGEQETEYYEGQ